MIGNLRPDPNTNWDKYAKTYEYACFNDVRALKPGNVSIFSGGHDMTANDFEKSAIASSDIITAPELDLGERIYQAAKNTHATVACNTNLGIILLSAPIFQAIYCKLDKKNAREAVKFVIHNATQNDTKLVYKAIRHVQAGGLGTQEKNDISETDPSVNLYDAMLQASEYDDIALQYVTGFKLVYEQIAPMWLENKKKWESSTWATTASYLTLLADRPDSLIQRKFGKGQAKEISDMIAPYARSLSQSESPEEQEFDLLELDATLKTSDINPGTTADLITAGVIVVKLGLLANSE
jgi:triphosphoribosyl-dephospho-CoA synthase